MPELAEIKLMSDFINKNKNKIFYDVKKNNTKVKTELSCLENKEYLIESSSRGKELKVTFRDRDNKIISPNGNESLHFAMGMSGNWGFARPDGSISQFIQTLSTQKHIKLTFYTNNGALVMYDVRNFAKWRWDSNWSIKRGPDPLTEFDKFKEHIKTEELNTRKKKLKLKSLNEILMDQYYFNGIGNYLRSTILNRFGDNPFKKFTDLSADTKEKLLNLCHEIPKYAYKAGGGQLYTFRNHNTDLIEKRYNMNDILDCYGKKDLDNVTFIDDKSNRRFWFDKKWLNSKEYLDYSKS